MCSNPRAAISCSSSFGSSVSTCELSCLVISLRVSFAFSYSSVVVDKSVPPMCLLFFFLLLLFVVVYERKRKEKEKKKKKRKKKKKKKKKKETYLSCEFQSHDPHFDIDNGNNKQKHHYKSICSWDIDTLQFELLDRVFLLLCCDVEHRHSSLKRGWQKSFVVSGTPKTDSFFSRSRKTSWSRKWSGLCHRFFLIKVFSNSDFPA